MAYIAETVAGDKRIQLGSEDFVRKMTMGANWQKIRIGMRVAINDVGAAIPNAALVIGVCQGPYPFISSSCIDFVGASLGVYDTNTYGRYAGPPVYFGYDYNQAIVKQGAVLTQATSSYATRYIGGAPASRMCSILVDIIKGSPNYTATLWRPQSTPVNVTSYELGTQLENENNPQPANVFDSPVNVAYSGSGLFDSVCIHWKYPAPYLEIADLTVVRYY